MHRVRMESNWFFSNNSEPSLVRAASISWILAWHIFLTKSQDWFWTIESVCLQLKRKRAELTIKFHPGQEAANLHLLIPLRQPQAHYGLGPSTLQTHCMESQNPLAFQYMTWFRVQHWNTKDSLEWSRIRSCRQGALQKEFLFVLINFQNGMPRRASNSWGATQKPTPIQ